jgi:NAD(P)-dependent dehydrogenase (short-subunit alcohol dehydrogenase family)
MSGLFDLTGRHVLVTGASSGLGRHFAGLLAGAGAKLTLGARRAEALAQTVASVEAQGGQAQAVVVNVTDRAGIEAALDQAEARFGPVSVLVNNAATLPPFLPIDEVDTADWRRVLDVNLTGSFFGIKHVVPSMRRAGGGSIVNTSSALGVMGTPNLSAYVSSKYGVRGLTQTAALELARDGIRVNSIHPGYTRTPMNADVSEENTRDLPVPRFAEPEEVTAVAMFLASEEASFVTGAEYLVDGGAVTGTVEVIEPT